MSALQQFFDAERQRRGWSMREVAKRSRISLSKAYAIANGDDNVEFETFENIATAFDMAPADLAIVIGKGSAGQDPDETEMLALFRQVPVERRPAATDMLRGLAVQPTRPVANRRLVAEANRKRDALLKMQRGDDPGADHGTNPSVAPWLPRVWGDFWRLFVPLAPAQGIS